MHIFRLQTDHEGFYDITPQVRQAITESGVTNGICLVYCPHTTAAVTINEHVDPDVTSDLIFALDRAFPDRPEFKHAEGNSAAHLKSSVIGCSVSIIVDGGRPLLGMWQGVYFVEFDEPRERRFFVKVISDGAGR